MLTISDVKELGDCELSCPKFEIFRHCGDVLPREIVDFLPCYYSVLARWILLFDRLRDLCLRIGELHLLGWGLCDRRGFVGLIGHDGTWLRVRAGAIVRNDEVDILHHGVE